MSDYSILLIDDEKNVYDSFELIFDGQYNLYYAPNSADGLAKLQTKDIDIVFLDINLPDLDGFSTLKKIKENNESQIVVMVTADRNTNSAVKAIHCGALDYITKPFNVDEVETLTNRILNEKACLQRLALFTEQTYSDFEGIVGESNEIVELRSLIDKIATADSTVLITGETGVGKELVAKAIHARSHVRNEAFIAFDCGAIPEKLIESELFGHEKGAFTGAEEKKIGKFELASEGVLFLDEISNMPFNVQAKMLRVLQEREFQRVGGNNNIKINSRIIAATNVKLQDMVKAGSFRQDLFHRLNVINIEVPPLRQRKEDITLLSNYFFKLYSKKFNRIIESISDELYFCFNKYNWPGNVRELSNVIERLVLLSDERTINLNHLPNDLIIKQKAGSPTTAFSFSMPLKDQCEKYERSLIINALHEFDYAVGKVSEVFGIHRNTLTKKMRQLNINLNVLTQEDCDEENNSDKKYSEGDN